MNQGGCANTHPGQYHEPPLSGIRPEATLEG